jgi:O-antigen ligase
MHPGYLSTYIGLALLASLYLFFTGATRRWLWLGAAGFLFFTMIMLQGRINILAMFAVLGLGALIAAIRQRVYKVLAIPALAIVIFGVILFFGSSGIKARFFEMPDLSYDITGNHFTSATYRLAEWSSAMMAIEKAPVFGHGIGDANPELVSVYEERGFREGVKRKFNAHNQYIETTLALGVAGLLILFLLLGFYVKTGLRNQNLLLIVTLIFFALCMVTESMLQRVWGVLLFNTFLPLLTLMNPLPEGPVQKAAHT